jgi:hypothetical protein
MLKETLKLFDDTLAMFNHEMEKLFKRSHTKTKVKIKAGSKVIINDVPVELVTDAIVLTSDPKKLMGE